MTGTFKDQPWAARFVAMGDTAEEVFEEVAPFGNLIRLGWNRPNIYMGDMSIVLKHMPDYYSGGYLIEVMGMGRDGILKLKLDRQRGRFVRVELKPERVCAHPMGSPPPPGGSGTKCWYCGLLVGWQ